MASAVAGAFILTVAYVYGYSLSLGTNLFTYFQVEDYLKLSVAWLTPTAVFVALCVLPTEFLEVLWRSPHTRQPDVQERSTNTGTHSRLAPDLQFLLPYIGVLETGDVGSKTI